MRVSPVLAPFVLVAVGAVAFGVSLLVRRSWPRLEGLDVSAWGATLGYVATAYGVVIGFSIVFLFGEFSSAKQAVGDEATSIGTAFEEVRLFPEAAPEVHHALICYARAVPASEWPAMRDGGSSSEVDVAYRNLVLSFGAGTTPTTGTFQPAAATNIFNQVGSISTAREARLVAAETQLPPLLVVLLLGGGVFVLALIFVSALPARPVTQALLVAASAMFTTVMVLIVFGLATPFAEGTGRVTPRLIEETLVVMEAEAPAAAARPCPATP